MVSNQFAQQRQILNELGVHNYDEIANWLLPQQKGEFWLFAYGALMWAPNFNYQARQEVTLRGFKRDFCVLSPNYRGTTTDPGLALGLVADAQQGVAGIAYRIAEQTHQQLMLILQQELLSGCYLPVFVEHDELGRVLAFIVDQPMDNKVALGLSLHAQAKIIAHAQGGRGTNMEYLEQTLQQLAQMPIEDAVLNELHALCLAEKALAV